MGRQISIVHGVRENHNVELEVWDAKTGEVLEKQTCHNLVVSAGLNVIRDLLHWMTTADGTRPLGIYYMSVGSGTAAFASTSTGLNTERHRDTPTQRTKSAAQTIYKLFVSASQSNGYTLTESGLHANTTSTSANTGELYGAVIWNSGVAKTSAIGITVEHTVSWADDGTTST